MDFLVLFLFYLALVLIGVVTICICSKTHYLRGLVRGGAQVTTMLGDHWIVTTTSKRLTGSLMEQNTAVIFIHLFTSFIYGSYECLQRAMRKVLHYLFHTRNHTFIMLHLLLQGLVYAEYTWEVFGYCQELGFSLHYLLLPYLLLVINLVFFTLSCVSNPGTITKANEFSLLQVYEFDEVMFPKNMKCFTCNVRKPARSKHCRVCNRCVHRFDHHCVWVNNCIGAWNARYFLIYLLTLTASAATMAVVSTVFLVQLVVVSDLYLETYVDDLGHLQVIDIVFLIQYLFLTLPRIVFMLGFVVMLSFLLGGYLCFTLYLAATNQTTNEWYRGDRAWCHHCPHVARPPSAEPQVYRNIHSHGLWSNLGEIFLPAAAHCAEKMN